MRDVNRPGKATTKQDLETTQDQTATSKISRTSVSNGEAVSLPLSAGRIVSNEDVIESPRSIRNIKIGPARLGQDARGSRN